MHLKPVRCLLFTIVMLALAQPVSAQLPAPLFKAEDVFGLEHAADPQISPDGKRIAYVRNSLDVMRDTVRSNLWMVNSDGTDHRPITSGPQSDLSPRWSPDGKRLLFISNKDGRFQIHNLWLDTRQVAQLTNLPESPTDITWSPDGKRIAFAQFVPERPEPLFKFPKAPDGAKWAAPPKVITKLNYRLDGKGYLRDGHHHLFVLSAEGGIPQQVTDGPFHHRGTLCWTPDGTHLLFSANRKPDGDYEPRESELFKVDINTKKLTQLTQRIGPDTDPVLSIDGKELAYLGFDDKFKGYQVTQLYWRSENKEKTICLSTALDRDVREPVWSSDGKGLYFLYEDQGIGKIGYTTLDGKMKTLAENVGGTTIDRPYASGSFSVSTNGFVAYTLTGNAHPADVAVYHPQLGKVERLTNLNEDLFAGKHLGPTEEIWYKSKHDGRKIQGWMVRPPNFNANKKYPLILEIHGGPFANYGPRFGVDMQLYAAAGYVVLYTNPRGSTSYGQEFGNLIHHDYPGHDYDDLMAGVDAVIDKGNIDAGNLFVTGGSGGGILTAWTIGKTQRFAGAVVCKPVINWYSFVLTADNYPLFAKYWFPGNPWDHAEHYLKRSPLSLVKNVTTPTLLITGEEDHRTPMSESEQYYQALKLLKVKTALVRIPGASHNMAPRPSQMIAKAVAVTQWFDMHKKVK